MQIIAPFWADVDTRGQSLDTGTVYYRNTAETYVLMKAENDVRAAFALHSDFSPTSAIVCTWYRVGYYDQNVDKVI